MGFPFSSYYLNRSMTVRTGRLAQQQSKPMMFPMDNRALGLLYEQKIVILHLMRISMIMETEKDDAFMSCYWHA
jgi:hypothetical protein